jgi:O-antigen ligase
VQVTAGAAASCGAAAVLVELPPTAAVVLTGVAGCCVLLALLRGGLRPPPALRRDAAPRATARDQDAEVARPSVESRLLAASRVLYYLGAATIGLLTIRPALSFTLSDWVFLIAIGVAVLGLVRARAVASVDMPPLILVGAAVFAVGGILSSFHAASPLGSAAVVVRVLYLTLPWFWVGIVLLRTPGQVQWAVTAWVASAALCGGAAVAQVFLGNVIPGGSYVAGGRATGFTSQFNVLGGLTAIAFVPGLMIAVRSRGRARFLTYPMIALVGAGLLLSGSVGGLLAVAAGTSVWLVSSGRARQTMAIAAVLVGAVLLLFSAKGDTRSISPFHRLSLVSQPEVPGSRGGTLNSRIGVYHAAWAHIRDAPFVGVGLDTASSTERIGEVHNVILGPWYTAGILGVLGVCILIGSVVHAGFRVVRGAATPDERLLAVALFASVIAFVVFALSEPIIYVRYGWAPVGFLLALRAQQRSMRGVDA